MLLRRWKYFVFSKYFLADGVYCYDHSLEWGKFKQAPSLPPLSASLGSHYYILADDLCSDLGRTDLNILQQRMDKYSSGKIFINITVEVPEACILAAPFRSIWNGPFVCLILCICCNDLTIGWQNLNLLSYPNATLVLQARQARASGENLNYMTLVS